MVELIIIQLSDYILLNLMGGGVTFVVGYLLQLIVLYRTV